MLHEIDLSRVDLNLLVLFETVDRERHVGRAAQRLNLSPSAVSHGLARLRRLLSDPLFLKTPRGVAPTERASELAGAIAEALRSVRAVLERAEPFDPATSRRRLTIGAPDGVSAMLLSPLLAVLRREAPGIDLAVRPLMPIPGEVAPERAWRNALDDLETRALDVAIVPTGAMPPRFHLRPLFRQDFVIAARVGHAYAAQPGLDAYCDLQHAVVSATGEAWGFVDTALAEQGRARRIALTLPNFMFAISVVAETDLLCAMPRRFVEMFGPRLGVVGLEPPVPLPSFELHAAVLAPALADAGLAWLLDRLDSGDLRIG
jgi:DNA-binding transcriptional LysR family regulator